MSTGMEIQLLDVRQHAAVLNKQQEQLEKWCAGGEVRAEGLIRYALAEMEQNLDLRNCTPTSVYLGLLACGVTGLVPGKLKGYSYLVPFGNTKKDGDREYRVQEATFMMGWKGVKHIGYRTGLDMVSAVICERDDFAFDVGTNRFVRYSPALKGRGPVIGAAAWVQLPRGGLEVEYLDLETLEKIKAAACRIRKSPAWEGPFKDQMQRKSALKRLGKQVEMGEEFLKADAIEIAQDEHGDAARALDEFTDGSATKFLSQQSTEAAVFGALPRPAQVQVPANAVRTEGPDLPPIDKLQAATDKARAADKQREEKARPTAAAQPAASARSQNSSASTSPPDAGRGHQRATGSSSQTASPSTPTPTSQTSAASTAGSASPPASATTPAQSGSLSSTTSPAPSESAPASSEAEPGNSEFGDVANEPGPTEDFDTSFGDEDPVDSMPTPVAPAEWVAAFDAWAARHPTKSEVQSTWEWFAIFEGWLTACKTKIELDADKPHFIEWTGKVGLSRGRKADPAKKIAAVPPDEQITKIQDAFARRYKEVP